MRQKHDFLIAYLSKVTKEMSDSALDNLLDKGLIGVREYNKFKKLIDSGRVGNK